MPEYPRPDAIGEFIATSRRMLFENDHERGKLPRSISDLVRPTKIFAPFKSLVPIRGHPQIHRPVVSNRLKKKTSRTVHHIPVQFELDEFQVTHTHLCPGQECASLKALTSASWFRHVRHLSLRCARMPDLERLLSQLSGKLDKRMVLSIKFTEASEWATGDPWVRKKASIHVKQLLSKHGMQQVPIVICNESDNCCIVPGR